ncbi:MAG TPA: ABC-F family ATP-binding cassette domain-containing protein [Candidatus Melainabacteria bacterium]|nr:ABC-F family ATP-binding cassette domain-containing protein [Candidatus Melainabacteria bacterium]
MLELHKLYFSFDSKKLFEDVSLKVEAGERVGVVGPNGSGKSTLLKLISGKLARHTVQGTILGPSPVEIVYIDCRDSYFTRRSLLALADPQWHAAREKMIAASRLLNADYERAFEEFESQGGWGHLASIEKEISLLGLDGQSIDPEVLESSQLSGGERIKAALCSLTSKRYRLALLDEPTNNLDSKSREWLIDFINSCTETFLIVSHDRDFLDRTCSRTFLLEPFSRSVQSYQGNYSLAMEAREVERLRNAAKQEVEKRLIERLTEDIRKTKEQASRVERATTNDYIRGRSKKVAAKAKARECRLGKILESKVSSWPKEAAAPCFELGVAKRPHRQCMSVLARQLDVGFSTDRVLIESAAFEISHGERVALVGDNGAGKSCLVNTIMGRIPPLSGELNRNPHLRFGHLSQGRCEYDFEIEFASKTTVLSLFADWGNEAEIRRYLSRIRLIGATLSQSIDQLSEGERTRLELALILKAVPDVLILDEPTNHLDIDSIEALENVLKAYRGTIILVSHDRRFTEMIAPHKTLTICDRRLI